MIAQTAGATKEDRSDFRVALIERVKTLPRYGGNWWIKEPAYRVLGWRFPAHLARP
jgi:hypothetical protein